MPLGSKIEATSEVDFYIEHSDASIDTTKLSLSPTVILDDKKPTASVFQGPVFSWDNMRKFLYVDYVSMRSKNSNDFGVMFEKWLFDFYGLTFNNIEDGTGCVR